MRDPIAVVTIENAAHYSQSSRENVIPSSGTSPLISYEEVPLPQGIADASRCIETVYFGHLSLQATAICA